MAETEIEAPAPGRADPSRERVIVWTILCLVVAFAASVFVTRIKALEDERFLGPFLENLVDLGTIGGFAIYLARAAPEGWRRRLLLVRPNLPAGAVVLCLLPTWGLMIFGGPLRTLGEFLLGPDPSPGSYFGPIFRAAPPGWWIAFAILVSIGPSVCEEILFRGYLQEGLLKSVRPFGALLVTMLFFTLGHPPIPRAMAMLPHAWWLGYLAYRTRSLVPSMLSHALINLTPLVLRPLRLNSDIMTGLWLILAAVSLPFAVRRLGRSCPSIVVAALVALAVTGVAPGQHDGVESGPAADRGAGEVHWAFVKPVPTSPPRVGLEAWPRNAIDRFVLKRLEEAGLVPSPEAPRDLWVRRVTFDLTGLPPTPAELDAFLADASERARETVVDRLLASPRFGERQAQEWMDLGRYADTDGYLYDEERSAWKWREWVIEAINRNLPYDQFVVEQIAGDLLPGSTLSQKIATGFNRNHPVNSEGGEADDEYRSAYVIDRANTTATAFLGLTLACAQCHDHKFDPLTQRDYYRFYAFFNDVDENGRNSAVRPTIPVPPKGEEAGFDELQARIKSLQQSLEGDDPAMDAAQAAWERKSLERVDPPIAWRTVEPSGMIAHRGSVLKQLPDGSVLATGEPPLRETYDLVLKPGRGKVAAVRLEVLPDDSRPDAGVGRGEGGRFIVTRLQLRVSTASDARDPPLVYVARAECDLNQEQPEHPIQFQALPGALDECIVTEDGESTPGGTRQTLYGWGFVGAENRKPHEAILLPVEPLALNEVSLLSVRIEQAGNPYRTSIGRFRISITEDERIRRVLLPVTPGLWSALGPFPAESPAKAWSTAFGPEAEAESGIDLARIWPRPGGELRGPRGGGASRPASGLEDVEFSAPQIRRPRPSSELAWEEKRWRDGQSVELEPSGAAAAWFVTRKVESTAARSAVLRIDGGAAVQLWVNGKDAWARAPRAQGPESRPGPATSGLYAEDGAGARANPDREARIELREGTNEIVAKIVVRGRGQRRRGEGAGELDQGPPARGASLVFTLTPEGDDVLTHEVLVAIRAGEARTGRQRKLLRAFYRERIDAAGRKLAAELGDANRKSVLLRRGMPTAMVMKDRDEPREAHVFVRGDFRRKGERVEAGVPAVLPPMSRDLPKNRLGLAKWLVGPDNPLTARVFANRVWQQYFGNGLVKTSEDFGTRGDPPADPALLDWLAVRLVESGWDVKALHRLVALSAVYAQGSAVTAALREKDPSNRLFARASRQRLSAEMIRDQALFASGLLVEDLGGPSVRPFQPEGLLQEVAGARSPERRDHGPAQYRRGLYVHWKRALPYPSMTAFDAAKRDVCTARRAPTTTPLQALVLLNDPVYVEAARVLAQRMMREGGATDAARIAFGFRWCTSRLPGEREAAVLAGLLAAERREYASADGRAAKLLAVGDSRPDPTLDQADLAAWTMVASALLNLDEAIHRG